MIFLTQSLHIAAYESAREGANADALAGDAQARAQSIFQDRGLNGAKIQFQPANPVALPRGTQFTATATAPTAENGIFALRFFTGSLASSVVMVKE